MTVQLDSFAAVSADRRGVSVEADWEASVISPFFFCRGRKRCTLPEANIAPVNCGWETTFPLGGPIFRAYVSFREGN